MVQCEDEADYCCLLSVGGGLYTVIYIHEEVQPEPPQVLRMAQPQRRERKEGVMVTSTMGREAPWPHSPISRFMAKCAPS